MYCVCYIPNLAFPSPSPLVVRNRYSCYVTPVLQTQYTHRTPGANVTATDSHANCVIYLPVRNDEKVYVFSLI